MNDLSNMARRNEKNISVLIPSRRPHLLTQIIENLIDQTKNLDKIEIILRLDYDDAESITNIEKLPHSRVDILVVIGSSYGGYEGTGFFFNEMAAISRGKFLCLFGDDVFMKTKHWDLKIAKHIGEKVVLDNGNWQFPAVSRKVYEKLGHICLGAHPDTWIHKIINKLPDISKDLDIEYIHDRYEETGRNKDDIYKSKVKSFEKTKSEYTQLVKDYLDIDVERLK